MMRDMAPDRGRRRDDPVTGSGRRDERIEIRDGARRNPDFGITRAEDLGGQSAAITSIFSIASSPISYLSPG
jgi:hypothetical protein